MNVTIVDLKRVYKRCLGGIERCDALEGQYAISQALCEVSWRGTREIEGGRAGSWTGLSEVMFLCNVFQDVVISTSKHVQVIMGLDTYMPSTVQVVYDC